MGRACGYNDNEMIKTLLCVNERRKLKPYAENEIIQDVLSIGQDF